jgi:hypothetical protein
MMAIVVTRAGAKAQRLERSSVAVEVELQAYIADNPECLPMEEIEEDLKLFIVGREFPTQSGPIDILATDEKGNVYVIETKLYKNPDKRKVIAQVLDYGAALWSSYGKSKDFGARIRQVVQGRSGAHLETRLQEMFGLVAEDVSPLLDSMQANVEAGRFRFIVLMDELDDRLKELITFVNENSSFSLFGVELEFYALDDYRIVIPRLFGAESRRGEALTASASSRRTWTEELFFADAASRLSADVVARMREAYEFTTAQADQVSWGTGAVRGSFSAKCDAISPKSLYSVYSDGRFDLNFRWLSHSEAGRRFVAALGQRLKAAGFAIPADYQDRFVTQPVKDWVPRWREMEKILHDVIDDAKTRAR